MSVDIEVSWMSVTAEWIKVASRCCLNATGGTHMVFIWWCVQKEARLVQVCLRFFFSSTVAFELLLAFLLLALSCGLAPDGTAHGQPNGHRNEP